MSDKPVEEKSPDAIVKSERGSFMAVGVVTVEAK